MQPHESWKVIHFILRNIDHYFSFEKASAHCDIPCKIYDPSAAQIAALTVIRMMDMIKELQDKKHLTLSDHAQLSRLDAYSTLKHTGDCKSSNTWHCH